MGKPSLSNLRLPPLRSPPWYGYGDFTRVVGTRRCRTKVPAQGDAKVPAQGGAQSRGRAIFTYAEDTSSDDVGDYTWSNWVVWKAREVEARDAALVG